jgi:hypothetical protein
VTIAPRKAGNRDVAPYQLQTQVGNGVQLKLTTGFYMVPLDVSRFDNLDPKQASINGLSPLCIGLDLNRYVSCVCLSVMYGGSVGLG